MMFKKIVIFLMLALTMASCSVNRNMSKMSAQKPPTATADSVATESMDRDADGVPDFADRDPESSPMTASPRGRSERVVITSSMRMTEPPRSSVRLVQVGRRSISGTSSDTKRTEGRIVYNIPDSMTVGKTFEVYARISHSRDTVTITENLTGVVRTSVIPVSEVMEVELIDPGPEGSKNFAITKNNDGRQIIEEGETYTEWRWDVTPTKSGNKTLKIVVSVIRGSERKQTVYVDQIVVRSNPKLETRNFFEKYWQWLTTTIVIPFVVWFYKRRKQT